MRILLTKNPIMHTPHIQRIKGVGLNLRLRKSVVWIGK